VQALEGTATCLACSTVEVGSSQSGGNPELGSLSVRTTRATEHQRKPREIPALRWIPESKGNPASEPSSSHFAESCIRKAVPERGFTPGLIGLADAKAEDEAASRWADCRFAYGD